MDLSLLIRVPISTTVCITAMTYFLRFGPRDFGYAATNQYLVFADYWQTALNFYL